MSSAASAGKRRGSILFGLLLVALGVLLLLTTLDAVGFGFWLELANYWPVLLVLIGVEIILAHRFRLLRVAIIAATLAAVIVAAYYSVPEYDPDQPLHAAYVEPLGDFEKLHLKAEFIGGVFQLSSPPATQPGAGLLDVDFRNRPARVTREQSNGQLTVRLSSAGPNLSYSSEVTHSYGDGKTTHTSRSSSRTNLPIGFADWKLTVSPDMEIDIDISSGASDLDLDLRDLNVRKLLIEAGAADIRVLLPTNAGETQVDIGAGAANIELIVPQSVAARIQIEAPIRSSSFDPTRFAETNDGYETPNYHNAKNRTNITIEALFADINMN